MKRNLILLLLVISLFAALLSACRLVGQVEPEPTPVIVAQTPLVEQATPGATLSSVATPTLQPTSTPTGAPTATATTPPTNTPTSAPVVQHHAVDQGDLPERSVAIKWAGSLLGDVCLEVG